ncbi:MAG TPA: DNA starvation/stationary phase protection protein [Chloroflexia bacterium]|nr:DNA starvation/stationary phase protection protein [Chloroflexia bacterium]
MAKNSNPSRGNGKGKVQSTAEVQPVLGQRGREIQRYGTVRYLPIGLDEQARQQSAEILNQILADTITLYSMYKKHHWQVGGPTFYQLHLLFDKHADEQLALVDLIAERIQTLGGISTGMPGDVARLTRVEAPPPGVEEVPVQISRLLEAHELICNEARDAIEATEKTKDWGTNDLLMSDVLRRNELQIWFVAQHIVDEPLVKTGERR